MRIWREAERGETVIITSFFTWGEVFKKKCETEAKPLTEEGDSEIEAFLASPFIEAVVVDEGIGVSARRLMRRHPQCRKPTDGIHLATALRMNVDEMHTYDGSDLLGLDEIIRRADGNPLRIKVPTPLPEPQPKEKPLPLLDLIQDDNE